MKGFAIHNAPTDHGGQIPSTQDRSSQKGNSFVRVGDGHMCPKCKTWSTVQPSHSFIIFDGKPVAFVGDQLTCGAKITEHQTHVIGNKSFAASNIAPNTNNTFNVSASDLEKVKKEFEKNHEDLLEQSYYKWRWGDLESKNPRTVRQEKQSFEKNFEEFHNQFAYGKTADIYEIDPKAWDGEPIINANLPSMIQASIDNNRDLGKALAKLAVGQSINMPWDSLGFGGNYFKTISTQQWPHGRWSGIAFGKLTKLGVDRYGKDNFQFKGYLSIEEDTYSWNPDNENLIKNMGIVVMGEYLKFKMGSKKASEVYKKNGYQMPVIYVRKFYFDYYKKGTKPPKY